jgi:beta-glucosidase
LQAASTWQGLQVGQNCSEGEANDRLFTIDFPGQQLTLLNELIATYPGVPIILVMINGGPISSPSIYQAASVQGIIEAWYAGEEGGHAVMHAVFGEFSPAGRLPVTIVDSMNELPLYINISMNAGAGRTHRYYTGKPLFPFGYGLSYTKFQYSACPSRTVSYHPLPMLLLASQRQSPMLER